MFFCSFLSINHRFYRRNKTGLGYFVSNREGGVGSDDIYSFKSIKPLILKCTQGISGFVLDRVTDAPIGYATVKLLDEDNKTIDEATSKADVIYSFNLDCKKQYSIRSEKEGYDTAEKVFTTPNRTGEVERTLFMKQPEDLPAPVRIDLAPLLGIRIIYLRFNNRKCTFIEGAFLFNGRNAYYQYISVMKNLEKYIRDISDFPKPGITFKDITPLLSNPEAMEKCTSALYNLIKDKKIDKVVGIESRGFFFGTLLAEKLNAGFIPVRKPGKLPFKTISDTYALEYGVDTLEMHVDAISSGERVLIHDDVLATGGTANAVCNLVEKLGGEIVQCNFLIELEFLSGKDKISKYPIASLLKY